MRAISRSGQPFDKVLADEDLSDLLAEKGFAVARRTVTKYRDVNGNQQCSNFGNSECSIFGIKTTVLLASAVQ